MHTRWPVALWSVLPQGPVPMRSPSPVTYPSSVEAESEFLNQEPRLIARQLDHPQSITWEGHSANPVPEAICPSTSFPISICGEFCLLAGNWLTAPCWNWQPLRDSFSFSASSDEAQSKGANKPQEQRVLPSNVPGKLGLEKAECSVLSWSHMCQAAVQPFQSLLVPSIGRLGNF